MDGAGGLLKWLIYWIKHGNLLIDRSIDRCIERWIDWLIT